MQAVSEQQCIVAHQTLMVSPTANAHTRNRRGHLAATRTAVVYAGTSTRILAALHLLRTCSTYAQRRSALVCQVRCEIGRITSTIVYGIACGGCCSFAVEACLSAASVVHMYCIPLRRHSAPSMQIYISYSYVPGVMYLDLYS